MKRSYLKILSVLGLLLISSACAGAEVPTTIDGSVRGYSSGVSGVDDEGNSACLYSVEGANLGSGEEVSLTVAGSEIVATQLGGVSESDAPEYIANIEYIKHNDSVQDCEDLESVRVKRIVDGILAEISYKCELTKIDESEARKLFTCSKER